MNRRSGVFAVGLLALLWLWSAALPARADLAAAMADYQAGRHEAAAREYERLAWLGLASAQSAIAVLYAVGEGVPRGPGKAAAWAGIAAQSGDLKARDLYIKILPSLGRADMDETIALERAYQAVALEDRLDFQVRGPWDVAAKRLGEFETLYPIEARTGGWEGYLYLAVDVDEQGRTHDPRVLIADPPGKFDAATVEALLGARWEPATLQGKPVASVRCLQMAYQFESEGHAMDARRTVKELRARADGGDASTQFSLALAWKAYPDARARIETEEAQRWMAAALEAKFPPALMFWTLCGSHGDQFGQRAEELARGYGDKELRLAASRGSPPAQIEIARALLAAEQLDLTARTRRAIGWLELAAMDPLSWSAQLRLAHVLATTPVAELRAPARARSLYESLRPSWGFHPLMKEIAAALALSAER